MGYDHNAKTVGNVLKSRYAGVEAGNAEVSSALSAKREY